jgi:hypothetical protein
MQHSHGTHPVLTLLEQDDLDVIIEALDSYCGEYDSSPAEDVQDLRDFLDSDTAREEFQQKKGVALDRPALDRIASALLEAERSWVSNYDSDEASATLSQVWASPVYEAGQ